MHLRKTTQHPFPPSIKGKRKPKAEALYTLSTKRTRPRVNGNQEGYQPSTPCLILLMRVERSLLKSASGASKFTSLLEHEASEQAWWLYECQDQALKGAPKCEGCLDRIG
eukprot:1152817-Pelagomonas_calceolata.AAC.1